MNAVLLLVTPHWCTRSAQHRDHKEINAADGSVASFGFCSECWQLLVDFHFHVLAGKFWDI